MTHNTHPMSGEKQFQDKVIPIQIRPEITVYISGIPHDLTQEEGDKIARVIAGYVVVSVA